MQRHFKHDLGVKERACCTLYMFIMRRRTERTDPSAKELEVKLMTQFGGNVIIFSNGEH